MRGSYARDDARPVRKRRRAYPRHVSQGSLGSDVSALRALAASLRTVELPAWLTQALDPDAVAAELRGRIGQVVPDALDLADVRLRDVRARRSWALRFDADVVTESGVRTVVLVADRPVPGVGPAPGKEGVLLPGLGLDVTATHGDAGLPALPTLTDATAVRPLLESALRDGGRPGLRLEEVRPHLVRYKPGQRATLVLDLRYAPDADPAWPRRVVAKASRGDGGASTDAWMRALWESGLGRRGAPRLAEPLGYLAGHRTLLQRALPGDRTLADLVADPGASADGPSLGPALDETADGLVALHASGVATGPPRTAAGELETARGLLQRLAPTLPERTRVDAHALLDSLAALAGDEQQQATPVHGAFRPAQVLLDGSHPGFLDFDGFGRGEPAFDVGRFLARLGELVADRTRRAQLTHAFLDRYRAGAPVPAHRTALWVCLDLATGAIRSWYRARPARATLLLDLLDGALDADW
jgi:hypothetical protein